MSLLSERARLIVQLWIDEIDRYSVPALVAVALAAMLTGSMKMLISAL